SINLDGKNIRVFAEKDPSKLDWESVGAQVVIEATGKFTKGELARQHLRGPVKKVIITAPATDEDFTVVMGVNEDKYDPAKHNVISNSTGAAKAVYLVIPDLKGKLDGFAMRVPTPNVSVVDLVVFVEKKTSVDEVNNALKAASESGPLKGYLGYE